MTTPDLVYGIVLDNTTGDLYAIGLDYRTDAIYMAAGPLTEGAIPDALHGMFVSDAAIVNKIATHPGGYEFVSNLSGEVLA